MTLSNGRKDGDRSCGYGLVECVVDWLYLMVLNDGFIYGFYGFIDIFKRD